jgi:hypothetical protein
VQDHAALPTQTAIDQEWKEYEPNIDAWLESPGISVKSLDYDTDVMIGVTPFPDNEPSKQVSRLQV